MASFGDKTTDYTSGYRRGEYHTNVKDAYQSSRSRADYDNKPAEYTVPIKKSLADNKTPESKGAPEKPTEIKGTEIAESVAGPAVFYPPGSTTFVKKEEEMHQVRIRVFIIFVT